MTPLQQAIEYKIEELLLMLGPRNETQEEFTSRLSYVTGNAPGTFDFWNADGKTPLRLACRPPEHVLHSMRDHQFDLQKNQTRLITALAQLGANPLHDGDTMSAICNVVSAMDIHTIINAFAECEQAGGHIRNEKGANPIQAMVPAHIVRINQLLVGEGLSDYAKAWMYEPHPLTGRDVTHETIHYTLGVKRPSISDNQQRDIKQLMRLMIEQSGSAAFMEVEDLSGRTAAQSLSEAIEAGKIADLFHDPVFAHIKTIWDRNKINANTANVSHGRIRTPRL